MMTPRKVKHRKWHRGTTKGKATQKTTLAFGTIGLKALSTDWITARQLESARRAMTRFVQRGGKIWIRVFTDKPVTVKGNEVRMGGGKGAVDHYVAVVRPGTIMFEMDGIDETKSRRALELAAHKLPVKTRIVTKQQ
ncbi:MAG: 50S ribosomal protein L16 [Patescibacteria group bacterium]